MQIFMNVLLWAIEFGAANLFAPEGKEGLVFFWLRILNIILAEIIMLVVSYTKPLLRINPKKSTFQIIVNNIITFGITWIVTLVLPLDYFIALEVITLGQSIAPAYNFKKK